MLGWELPPHYVGGMGIVCDQLTRQMAKDGVDIEFILPFYADYSHIKHMKVTAAVDQNYDSLANSGSTYDSNLYQLIQGSQQTGNFLYEQVENFATSVGRIVKRGEYDVIHAHDWLTIRAGILAKKVSGLPLFLHVHATEYDRAAGQPGNPLVSEIEYVGMQMADHIFAVSQRTKQDIVEHYDVAPSKITVAENVLNISPDMMAEAHDSYPYLEAMRQVGYKIVVNAGRMTIQKGIMQLLDAARLVVDKRPRTLFLLAGGGEQIPELQMKAAALGLSGNVIFTGRLEGVGKQWRDSFRVADLFVMPSVSEPLGITPYEAIAYGAPALVSKQSGISEVLTNILKVDYWDTNQMANQILAVLGNQDLHDTLLANARAEYSKLSWAPIASRIYDRYQKACQRHDMRLRGAGNHKHLRGALA